MAVAMRGMLHIVTQDKRSAISARPQHYRHDRDDEDDQEQLQEPINRMKVKHRGKNENDLKVCHGIHLYARFS